MAAYDDEPTRFEVITSHTTAIVAVHGEIDLDCAQELTVALNAGLSSAQTDLIVDLDDCGFMDSTGLKALFACLRRARLQGVQLLIAAAPDKQPASVIEMIAPGILETHEDRATALAAITLRTQRV